MEDFLKEYPFEVQRIAQRVRKLVKATVPDLTEAVYPGWKLIGYRATNGKRSFYFGFILPKEDRVLLGFEYGRLLSDPEGLLGGEGKQVRHISIRNLKDIRTKAISPLVMEAAVIALERGNR